MTRRTLLFGLSLVSLMGLSPDEAGMGDRVRAALDSQSYIAHEWGTFTSLQGSSGTDQIGLHHGDERLPRFVHCPLGFSYGACLSQFNPDDSSPLATTQRMETPVIYFYSNSERTVRTKVDFPNGVITEWFPNASEYFPRPGEVENLTNGTMTWLTTVKTDVLEVPHASNDEIWHAQRQVDSNYVTNHDGENEKFIFYRGVGRFTLPFSIQSNPGGDLVLRNASSKDIPSVLLLNFDGTRGSFRNLGTLRANSTLELSGSDIPKPEEPADAYVARISQSLFLDLTASGLFPLEAQAMVDTWKRSYFLTPGLRALYVLPRSWVDEIVPIQCTPQPVDLVRTFVGRLEIFTAQEEAATMVSVRKAISEEVPAYAFPLEELGRFAEPKLWRLRGLASTDQERDYIREVIRNIFRS